MSVLPPGAIIPFNGNHANIPAKTSRKTSFDGKYIKITTSDWGNTGGNPTHTHVSPSHTHTYIGNSHVHASGIISGNAPAISTNARHEDNPTYDITSYNHPHPSVNTGTIINEAITASTATIGNADNEYSNYELIFIEVDEYTLYPVDSLIIRNDTADRANSTHFDSLDNKYMKGAATASNPGNIATVATHNHSIIHSHTLTHGHNSAVTGNATSGSIGTNFTGSTYTRNHGHTVYFEDNDTIVNDSVNSADATSELSYRELHFWKVTTACPIQLGDIALFTGATLPTGWDDMGYSDVYAKGKASGGALTTGGSNTHSHTNYNHNHSGGSHTHPWSTNTETASNYYDCCASGSLNGSHSHIGNTESATDSDTGSSDIILNSANHEPEYVKARLIQATSAALGGGGSVIPRIMSA